MLETPPQLLVVMPVFTERESVARVILDWIPILQETAADFLLLAIDDGSTDDTADILTFLKSGVGDRLEIISRPNRGHGQTCLQGYRIAVERNIPFILQIDSDGQSDPRYFPDFWDIREHHDVIYGKRSRQDGSRRVIASFVLRTYLQLLAGVDCVDANVPYRLMDTTACAKSIATIPAEIDLANIALAVCLRRDSSIRHGTIPIGFPPRHGGESSVPFSKFATKASELFEQLKLLK